MEWRDTGLLLGSRRHGESSLILDVFTPSQGRHAGVLRGGTSRKMAPHLQPGADLDLTWRARLEDHIGAFTHVEPQRSRAAAVLSDRLALAGMNAVLAMLQFCLPERAPHPELYRTTMAVLDLLDTLEIWPLAYLRWEVGLLEEMGFGLDLTVCAVTGAQDGLVYVSPKTGRAVTAEGAGDWAAKLLPLPPVLLGEGEGSLSEIVQALGVTEHFLTRHLAASLHAGALPDARGRMIDRLHAA